MVTSSEVSLRASHHHAHGNRAVLALGGRCGCFHCLNTFEAPEIAAWVDDGATALCPRCGIDAVLSARCDPIDREFLSRMQAFWFGDNFTLDAAGDAAPRP